MPFAPFHKLFPEVARRETRCAILSEGEPDDLPAGEYSFVELYCNEPSCDCRRVMLTVISAQTGQELATIAYGWESADFYRRWMGGAPIDVAAMQGPILNFGSRQSRYAPALLDLAANVLLADNAYVERLKRHYRMFRDKIEEDQPAQPKKAQLLSKKRKALAKKKKRKKRRK